MSLSIFWDTDMVNQENIFERSDKRETILYAVNEWKSNQVKVVVIIRVLYGLKYSALE